MKEEIINQAEALSVMHGDVLGLIDRHAEEFRAIINDFKEKFNRVPTADELIWIASEHAHKDLRLGRVRRRGDQNNG